MAKRIQVSIDAGATWFTLPGNKASFTQEASDINDTIFGQDYQSGQTGLIGWSIDANGLYKGFAGYVTKIKKSGISTAFNDEAAALLSGKTYKISDSTKSVWDRSVAITVEDNTVAVPSADIESVDYLLGTVTFDSGYTPTGPITISGNYLPMATVAGANSFTLTQSANGLDVTTYDIAQANGGYREFDYGLKTVQLSLKGIYSPSNGFEALLQSRAEMIIEITPDGSNKAVARGWFKPTTTGQSGNVGELEEQTLDFVLSVPDQEGIPTPFSWNFDVSATLSQALRHCLTGWTNNTKIDVNYLADGATGWKGKAVITDMTLTGGLDVMNEFTVKAQGTGAPVAHP